MPLRVCSLGEHSAEGMQGRASRSPTEDRGQGSGQGSSPLAHSLAALEVRGQVAHAMHGLHQLPQVRLDLWTGRRASCTGSPPLPTAMPPLCPPVPAGGPTSSMARISRRSLSITVMKSWGRVRG